ncbi:universal stress protein UspC [Leclercia adecarboxylata]|uniref:universal stress protein UspC n=1 Tax=Leclercia adecarboxylata TaxID=83655 RepID=UPI002DBF61E6|nr:universal stress protein UspC [Leclercia adecarboxylata]MEB6378235.1 universal stress protein UspC [Leclercia adecarboxylata]
MSYSHILVSVSLSSESHQLIAKAVAIARPTRARITLVTLTAEPEMYNQLAAPMLEDIRGVIQEESRQFLEDLIARAEYPIAQTVCATGELSEQISDICQQQNIDLVICGNHNQSFFSRATCSAKTIVNNSHVDVLLIPLSAE